MRGKQKRREGAESWSLGEEAPHMAGTMRRKRILRQGDPEASGEEAPHSAPGANRSIAMDGSWAQDDGMSSKIVPDTRKLVRTMQE
jgi:hypothetical protein